MKKITFLIIIVLLFVGCSDDNKTEYISGTIKYVSLEGGFWGIVSDDNKNYDPINLPDDFKVDGKRIVFSFIERNDLVSFYMWGTIIELKEIKSKYL